MTYRVCLCRCCVAAAVIVCSLIYGNYLECGVIGILVQPVSISIVDRLYRPIARYPAIRLSALKTTSHR